MRSAAVAAGGAAGGVRSAAAAAGGAAGGVRGGVGSGGGVGSVTVGAGGRGGRESGRAGAPPAATQGQASSLQGRSGGS